MKIAAAPRLHPLLNWLMVAAVIVALYAFDVFMAGVERTELKREAGSLFAQGRRLESARRAEAASRLYRRALAIDRGNVEYQIALGRALALAGHYGEAAPVFDDVLDRYPDDGRANLEMARLCRAEGNLSEAASYFHRAIYGSWRSNAQARRIEARLELMDMLVRAGRRRELLAELLPLEDEAPDDSSLRLRIANLFMAAGSPARAAAAYRAILAKNPDDARAYEGLGEAELQRGNYHAAQSAFVSALRRKPDDDEARRRLRLAAQAAQLDPVSRRLPFQERLARSRRILSMTMAQLEQCAPGQENAEIAGLTSRAAKALHQKQFHKEDPIETALSAAEDAWSYVQRACPAQVRQEEALALVMSRLQQRP
jgi:tetratricopeptide (TPR) repeat protein